MTDGKSYFTSLMADFGRASGIAVVHDDDSDEWIVPLEGGIVRLCLAYRPATDQVITSAVVAPFAPSIDPARRARALLEMNWQWKESRGFTVAVDGAESCVIIVDRRAADGFTSPAALGAYCAKAGEVVREIRSGLADFEATARCLVEDEILVGGKVKED